MDLFNDNRDAIGRPQVSMSVTFVHFLHMLLYLFNMSKLVHYLVIYIIISYTHIANLYIHIYNPLLCIAIYIYVLLCAFIVFFIIIGIKVPRMFFD